MLILEADKIECVRLSKIGLNSKEVYDRYYHKKYPTTSYESFKRTLRRWKNRYCADTTTLVAGTYPDFRAHNATVQVNSSGDIVQAWIKQREESIDWERLVDTIKESTTPEYIEVDREERGEGMLEIPIFDMHFPLSDYENELNEILCIIDKKNYEDIYLVIGQDLFHNDDFRGRTSSGRVIERVDMVDAWNLADRFWYNIVAHSLEHADHVHIIYSKGNHDESLGWAFIQRLKALFPQVDVDDSMKARKCIYWKGCFIGLTHGYSKKNNDAKTLRSIFTIEYPQEFAKSKVREIHAGHLHHEQAGDIQGITVRRLSTAVPTDEWSDDEGYVGSHKRFMIFEWEPNKLKSIHFTYE